MSEKRIIKINEDMFKIPNKTRKSKPPSTTNIKVKAPKKEEKSHTLKRKLLQIIRNKQNEKVKTQYDPKSEESVSNFENDFNSSLEYLSNLQSKQPPKLNGTIRNYNPSHEHVNLELPAELAQHDVTSSLITPPPVVTPVISLRQNENIPPTPQYGCMKNGNLPTFRTWKRTTQKNYEPIITQKAIHAPVQIIHTPVESTPVEEKVKKQKKIIRRNFTIGKSRNKPLLSVLVSNRTLRNRTSTQQKLLQQTPIEDIKKHLIKRGFIKVGCIAPNDVLRQMYESTMMICGDVKNHNQDYLLHNFLHQENH